VRGGFTADFTDFSSWSADGGAAPVIVITGLAGLGRDRRRFGGGAGSEMACGAV